MKFGSKEWFSGLIKGLAQAGLNTLSNAITATVTRTGQTGSGTSTATPTVGSAIRSVASYLPYALLAAFGVVLILILRKK